MVDDWVELLERTEFGFRRWEAANYSIAGSSLTPRDVRAGTSRHARER